MRGAIIATGLAVLTAGCGKSSEPVGENSAGSIRTTAVGEIVGTVPSPTPIPTGDGAVDVDNVMADNETE